VLTLIRLGFFFGDNGLITENLPKAEKCDIPILHELELITGSDSLRRVVTGIGAIV